jgi:ATP-binding cassette subfamily B protein
MAAHEPDWASISWPANRLGDLIENLARRGRLVARPHRLPPAPAGLLEAGNRAVGYWIDAAAGHLNLEAEAIDVLYADLEQLIRAGGPMDLRVPGADGGDPPRLIGLVRGNRAKAYILAPDLHLRSISIESLRAAVCSPFESPLAPDVDRLLQEAHIPAERLPRSRRVILQEQLGPVRIQGGWILRLPPGAGLWAQLRRAGAVLPALSLLALYLLQQLLTVASWFVLGRGVFAGHFDWGWVLAWAILLLSTIPLQILVYDAQSELSLRTGVIFKQRLLEGTLKLEPEEIRHQGMGQFLGRVMESEAVELLGLSGGFMALLSFIEIFLAVLILNRGAGGTVQALTLVLWVLITLGLLWNYYQTSREWAVAYREMTNDLVERMVGHRTRLAQEDPGPSVLARGGGPGAGRLPETVREPGPLWGAADRRRHARLDRPGTGGDGAALHLRNGDSPAAGDQPGRRAAGDAGSGEAIWRGAEPDQPADRLEPGRTPVRRCGAAGRAGPAGGGILHRLDPAQAGDTAQRAGRPVGWAAPAAGA